jgi:penicillin amidase
VTWTLSGPGALSGTTGAQVVYRPPAGFAAGTHSTLTAQASGQSASVQLNLVAPVVPAQTIPNLTAAVQVTYDAQDIPHIFCSAINDCLAVQGFIQARDRLFQMDLFRRTARGQLASLVGPLQVGQDQQLLTLFTTRDGKRIEDELVAALDADTKSKLTAFTTGVNAYLEVLAANPALLPAEYAQLPFPIRPADIPQWTLQDTLGIGRLQQFQLSETIEKETNYGLFAATYGPGGTHPDANKMTAWIRARQGIPSYTISGAVIRPPALRGSPAPALAPAPDLSRWGDALAGVRRAMSELRSILGTLGIDAGSNNWVVDGAHSATGKAMVANDPHLSLQYPPLFHLSAMTATDNSGLDTQGGAFPGVPGNLIGRGKHVGWGDTVVGYDVTDLYLETLTPCATSPAGLCAQFNGAPVPILPVPLSIKVRGSGGLSSQPFTVLLVPHHGPIIQFDQTHLTAVSMRWTGHEITNDVRAFLNLNLATAVGNETLPPNSAFAALKDIGTGAQNFVLADDQGNIGYDPHALVPKRPWAGSAPAGIPLLPWFPLPGDGSAEWGTGSAGDNCAGVPPNLPADTCWVADADLPFAVNPSKGYLATANSDPRGDGDDNNPIVNPGGTPYLSLDWDDSTGVRIARITDLLGPKTANGGKVALSDMVAVQSDHVSRLAQQLFPALPPASGQSASYQSALTLLTTWKGNGYDCPSGLTGSDPNGAASTDGTVLTNSAACLLFHTFVRDLLNDIFNDDLALAKVPADGGIEIRTLLFLITLPANDPGANFCNNVNSSGAVVAAHSCAEQMVIALGGAFDKVTATYGSAQNNWIWGRVHTMSTASPASPLIANGFTTGPFARPGGALTVDVGNPVSSQSSVNGFAYTSGSNLRFIAVMDPANAQTKMQLPGPQRDVPTLFSSGPNLLGSYVLNQYFDFLYSHQVDAAAASVQTFNPR